MRCLQRCLFCWLDLSDISSKTHFIWISLLKMSHFSWRSQNVPFQLQISLDFVDEKIWGRLKARTHWRKENVLEQKIVLHLRFGWSLDKDQQSLDESKQIPLQFGSIQTKKMLDAEEIVRFGWLVGVWDGLSSDRSIQMWVSV